MTRRRTRQQDETARKIGDQLHERLASDESYAILDKYPEISGTTWTAGACWPLAQALASIFPDAKMMAIVSGDSLSVQHAVAAWRGGYLDADGWSYEYELLDRWREEELVAAPSLVPFEDAYVQKEMACPAGVVRELSTFLGDLVPGHARRLKRNLMKP